MQFQLVSQFKPTGDQPQAIKKLVSNINKGIHHQVLLGVTGSGKTFTIANVIEKIQLPVLVISHNKTLAGQLYQEFRDFFPTNAVSYFVSYYDYYQPEAYLPSTDTYIEKETDINQEIDKLRLSTTTNLLTRKDTLVVASVSCIYNLGSPREYGKFILELREGMSITHRQILKRLIDLQYIRTNYDFTRGSFRIRGETIDVYLAYQDKALRILVQNDTLERLSLIDPISLNEIDPSIESFVIYPAKHYMTNPSAINNAYKQIQKDLQKQVAFFKKIGKNLEAHRIQQRVSYDLEMIQETGYVNGIENYSRYFDGRNPGDPPYTLIDYYHERYGKNWLLIIDESHMTIPQLRGMYRGDRSRKQTLIDFGFRLPSALDNRPYTFQEFIQTMPNQCIYVSATPSIWEIEKAKKIIVEQLIRPTGLVDPKISIRKVKGQIKDLTIEIKKKTAKGQRVLVTTLTKRMAEDLSDYLRIHINSEKNKNEYTPSKKRKIKIAYLHSDIDTLKRQDILDDLRKGVYDVLIGINLLREGLDLPEVSLVAILDADKEGFLRSKTSLIQTMGRAARHKEGMIIMYADTITNSMKQAIKEVNRRRKIQLLYNKKHHITPRSISKPIRKKLIKQKKKNEKTSDYHLFTIEEFNQLTPQEKKEMIKKMKISMRRAARNLDFEEATFLRDLINNFQKSL